MKISFEGGKALEAALLDIEKMATRKTITRKALRAAAEPIAEKWAGAAPVKSGKLRDSIHIGTRLNRRQMRMVKREGKAEVTLHIGPSDAAGLQQEFGNKNHGPQPSARPAWETEGGAVAQGRIGDAMWSEINRAAARQAKAKAKAG